MIVFCAFELQRLLTDDTHFINMNPACLASFGIEPLIGMLEEIPSYDDAGPIIDIIRQKVTVSSTEVIIGCERATKIYVRSLGTRLELATEDMLIDMIVAGMIAFRTPHMNIVTMAQQVACSGSYRLLAAIFIDDRSRIRIYRSARYGYLFIDNMRCARSDTWRLTFARALVLVSRIYPDVLSRWWSSPESRYPYGDHVEKFDWSNDMVIMTEISRLFAAGGLSRITVSASKSSRARGYDYNAGGVFV